MCFLSKLSKQRLNKDSFDIRETEIALDLAYFQYVQKVASGPLVKEYVRHMIDAYNLPKCDAVCADPRTTSRSRLSGPKEGRLN